MVRPCLSLYLDPSHGQGNLAPQRVRQMCGWLDDPPDSLVKCCGGDLQQLVSVSTARAGGWQKMPRAVDCRYPLGIHACVLLCRAW
eukprot:7333294-Lingulodinium_polyedra.AAC.1